MIFKGMKDFIYFISLKSGVRFNGCSLLTLAIWCLLLQLFIFGEESSASSEAASTNGLRILDGHLLLNGSPTLLLGDSVTQGWMEHGENFAQENYLDALAARRINLVMIWSFIGTSQALQVADDRIGYDAPEIWPWVGSPDRGDFDLTRFNQLYFDRLKAFVAYAEKKKIVVLLTLHDGWVKDRFAAHPFNHGLGAGPLKKGKDYVKLADYSREMPATYDPAWSWQEKNQHFQERFCDKMISELSPFGNVIYEIFNEGEWYNPVDRQKHEQHFLTFFSARCENILLSNTDHILLDGPWRDTKVDIVSFHGKPWTGWFKEFEKVSRQSPSKPYLKSEPVPGWRGDFPVEVVRKSVWEHALAKSGWVAQNDTSFGWDGRSRMADKVEVRDQAYDAIGICSNFFNDSGIPFWRMKPQGTLSSTGICLAEPGREYLIYAPEGGIFTVDLSTDPKANYEARWFNPRIGKFAGSVVVKVAGIVKFHCPDANDWILHVVRDGKGVATTETFGKP